MEKDWREIFYQVAKGKVLIDHVHLFISFDPRIHIHTLIQKLKGRSSRMLHEKYPSWKSRLPSL
ncbi:transposase [Saccharococcus caldoxylosilyticus]|uniref:Putative transposase n=1 Tax=Parageobacillus caldoxylosilyticus NBRC 107762 TaxID=1220594 RepID=A0A023DFV7_9BACL|nr:transposase [Parageobacillus caldoxylosilyticus]MBB3851667.1 putative transposase [Parageobacillus caldoxylosilyticus]GAJ40147.1 putative transposase [Parageobacillus caldoxylosilyticus NBRC 107762]